MKPVSGRVAPAVTAIVLALLMAGRAWAQVPPAHPDETAPAPKSSGPAQKKPRPAPDDKRRTLRSYGSNLVYDFLGVVTPGNRVPLLVTAALTARGSGGGREHPGLVGQHSDGVLARAVVQAAPRRGGCIPPPHAL